MARRTWMRVLVATCAVAVLVVLYHEVQVHDSRRVLTEALALAAKPEAATATPLKFVATAYCKGTTTASGVPVQRGIAAADPMLLPVGSIVRAATLGKTYDGIYTVMDTGPLVRGRRLDVYLPNCYEALRFGRRTLFLTIVRLGWSPQATAPDLVAQLFRRRERAIPPPIAAEPLQPMGPVMLPGLPVAPQH